MGQDAGDRHAPAGPMPERFEVFHLREYPKVVELLHGLLGSRLVAEELAQETFLVAYRDWDRISRLDNPRAWVRKVAINPAGLVPACLPAPADTGRPRRGAVRGRQDQAGRRPRGGLAGEPHPAAALGRAPGTIKAQLHHGRRKLARLLEAETDRRSSL